MPRTKSEKITPDTVAQLGAVAKAALHTLHEEQAEERESALYHRRAIANRQEAEKQYTLAVRRWKLAEAKLPPPAPSADSFEEENLKSEVLAEESLSRPESIEYGGVYVHGEPVEV
jgi:hypothetical protein